MKAGPDQDQAQLRWLWSLTGLLVFGLLASLAFYNCPQSDDFFYAMWMRDWGFADANITIYFGWGGRYFSNIILTLGNSLGYSSNYHHFLIPYQLHSIFHLTLFFLSGYILFKRAGFISGGWVAVIPLLFFIGKASSLQEFFYWLAGAATYCSGFSFGMLALTGTLDWYRILNSGRRILPSARGGIRLLLFILTPGILLALAGPKPIILFLNQHPLPVLLFAGLFIASLLFFLNKKDGNRPLLTLASLLFCSFACAGCSELAGALLIVCMSLAWLWNASFRNIPDAGRLLPLLFGIAALALNIFAPATANREGSANASLVGNWEVAMTGAFSVFLKIRECLPELISGLLLGLFAGANYLPDNKALKKYFLLFLGFQFLANGLLPLATLLKAGELPSRAINLHQAVMTVSVFLVSCALGRHLSEKINPAVNRLLFRLNFLLPLLLLSGMGSGNYPHLIQDLFSGRASAFYHEFCAEQEAILNCTSAVCELAPLKSRPVCISSMSNAVVEGQDPPNWVKYKNDSYAAFYGKKYIFRKTAR